MLPLLLIAGCSSLDVYPPKDGPGLDAPDTGVPDADADTDSDTDADSDADADADTDADSDADTDTHTGSGPWSNGDPTRPPVVTSAPPDWFSGCAVNGMLPAPIVDDPDNEVVVDAFSDTYDVHHMDVTTAGWYHLYNDPPANDGPTQWNESIFIRIQNGTYPQSSAVLTNCGDDWITVDGDNVPPVPVLQYLGTFWFDAGRNTIVVAHFCPVVNAGQCGALENRNDPGSRCAGPDNNRLRMVSNGLCIAEPAP